MDRRNSIIGQMQELGWVTRAEAQTAIKEDLKVQVAPERARYHDADYFVEEVRQEALSSMGQRLNEGGYYMRTTLDPRLQTIARVALMHGLEVYDHRHGWRGPFGRAEVSPGWEARAESITPPAERRAWRSAIVESVEGSRVRVQVAHGGSGELLPEDVAWAKAGKGLQTGDLVFVEPVEGAATYHLRQIPIVNGALVAIEPNSGRVLALVGGYSFSLSKFNRATQAMRQPALPSSRSSTPPPWRTASPRRPRCSTRRSNCAAPASMRSGSRATTKTSTTACSPCAGDLSCRATP